MAQEQDRDGSHNGASVTKLGAGFKLAYGSGQMVDAATQAALGTFLLFYLTTVCGISPDLAGIILFLSLAIDAVADPLIGAISDHYRSRWGRRLPFMAGALAPLAASITALFALPSGMGASMLFAYVLGLNIVVRVSLSVFSLPYSALAAEVSDDYRERSSIMAYRSIFIVLGTFACLGPAFSLIFSGRGGLQEREAYPLLGLLIAFLTILSGLICILGVSRQVRALPPGHGERGLAGAADGFLRDISQLLHNPTFMKLFAGAIIVLIGSGSALALNLHAYRFYWGLSAEQIQLPTLALPVGMLIGTPFAVQLLRHVEKRTGALVAIILLAVTQGSLPLLNMTGILPHGNPLLGLLIANGAVFGICSNLCFICFYSMAADAIDEHDHLFGVRCEGLYYASLTFAAKAATGVGSMLAGLGLKWIGFPAAHAPSDLASLPSATVVGLGLLWGPGLAVLLFAGAPFFLAYRLDRRRHEALIRDLRDREAGNVPAVE
ncbi:MFS transporter [Sphingobium sp. AN641]|uniref:MFS transporter n=1 Tax=Sphingobium sp. AN641 TaxID=3133443 RepID=UPI0030C04A06